MEYQFCAMESMAITSPSFWKGKRVFVTGHTGFKGSWLVTWLADMGAVVCGYSLPPIDDSLWTLLDLPEVKSVYGDILDEERIRDEINLFSPDIVIHLAAQAIVEAGYREPGLTFSTNVIGTYNVLMSSINSSAKIILNVTTDKVYENSHPLPHKESDPLGGNDPYSASKACSEIVTHSLQSSFAEAKKKTLISARAGNVIGGGDFSSHRIIPDIVNAAKNKTELEIRRPDSVRPWQHVLDALSGYLLYVESAWSDSLNVPRALNFSPRTGETLTVRNIVEIAGKEFPELKLRTKYIFAPFKEDEILLLDSSLASSTINWAGNWDCRQAIMKSFSWYESFQNGASAKELILSQIKEFSRAD